MLVTNQILKMKHVPSVERSQSQTPPLATLSDALNNTSSNMSKKNVFELERDSEGNVSESGFTVTPLGGKWVKIGEKEYDFIEKFRKLCLLHIVILIIRKIIIW